MIEPTLLAHLAPSTTTLSQGALPGFLLTIAATFYKEHRHAISH